MRRRRRGVSSLDVSTSYVDPETDEETDINVECSITPGEPEVRYQRNGDPGWPGCGPEVEILSAKDDSGKDWTEEISADRDWLARVEEKAIEAFGEPGDEPDRREDRW